MAPAWLTAVVIMAITIVGIPWTRAAFTIAGYTLLPFGRIAMSREAVTGREDIGTGALSTLGYLIWLLIAGWWPALGPFLVAVALAIYLIGLHFAGAHHPLVTVSLLPLAPLHPANRQRDVYGNRLSVLV